MLLRIAPELAATGADVIFWFQALSAGNKDCPRSDIIRRSSNSRNPGRASRFRLAPGATRLTIGVMRNLLDVAERHRRALTRRGEPKRKIPAPTLRPDFPSILDPIEAFPVARGRMASPARRDQGS